VNFRYVGERLLAERRRRGLTQAQVAQQVGVSQAHISAIETGRSLDWTTINKLGELYDIPQHALAGRALGIRSEVEDAIEVAVELNATDRALLLAMYQFMRARGPLSNPQAA
jgi:transcriptional regulator with XRE-family HTH domain